MKIKGLAELLSGKAGRNSLLLQKMLCGFFSRAFPATNITYPQWFRGFILQTAIKQIIQPSSSAERGPGRKMHLPEMSANYNGKKEIPQWQISTLESSTLTPGQFQARLS
jgi:hypothetical protein